jgi:hypothetical protein
MSKTIIKLEAETQALKDAIMSWFINYKPQFTKYLKMTLDDTGVKSDLKILIQGDKVVFSVSSGDKGIVIRSSGIGFESVAYDTLQVFEKYMVVENGLVNVFVKLPDGIDQGLAAYKDLMEAVENINNNDIEGVVAALRKSFEPKENLEDGTGETTEQDGNTEQVVQGVQADLQS